GAANAPFRKRLEFDAPRRVEAVSRVDQPDDSVLHKVAHVDRMRHRRRHPARERFDEGESGDYATILTGGDGLGAHLISLTIRDGDDLRGSRTLSIPDPESKRRGGC